MTADYRQAMPLPRSSRLCKPATQEHTDGVALIELLLDAGGKVEATQDELAAKLGMLRLLGGGFRATDLSRFHRARNHVRDCVDSAGQPCCGFGLHYRKAGRVSVLALIDPSGDLGEHADAAIASILGWITRERQHHSENTRMTESFQLLASHALARGDLNGQRLCITASIEIEQHGTVQPATMALLRAWAGSLR
jgi:hypothetical protein